MSTPSDTTVHVSPEVQARRDAATIAFKQKAHDLYHRANGAAAPCHWCANIARTDKGFAL